MDLSLEGLQKSSKLVRFVQRRIKRLMNGFQSLFTKVNRYHKTNALHPLNWLIGVFVPATLVSFQWINEVWIRECLIIVDIGLILFYAGMYLYFAIKSPDRLHTEEYLLEVKRLDIFAQQGVPPQLLSEAEIVLPKQIPIKP